MSTWREIARVEPEPKRFRVRCTHDDACPWAPAHGQFVMRTAAESLAQMHANDTGHVVAIECNEEKAA